MAPQSNTGDISFEISAKDHFISIYITPGIFLKEYLWWRIAMQHKDSSKITFRSKFFNKEGDGHKRIELYISEGSEFQEHQV